MKLNEKGPNDPESVSSTNRRNFLGGMGMLGLSLAAVGPVANASGQPSDHLSSSPSKLSSINGLDVTRNELLDVPGGKEQFLEWRASDSKGVTQKFIVHTARIDNGSTYAVTTNLKINTYNAGINPEAIPSSSMERHITAFGVKGPVSGKVRNDQVIFTTVFEDGSTTREEKNIPVRLDLSEYTSLDATTMITKIGNQYLGLK